MASCGAEDGMSEGLLILREGRQFVIIVYDVLGRLTNTGGLSQWVRAR